MNYSKTYQKQKALRESKKKLCPHCKSVFIHSFSSACRKCSAKERLKDPKYREQLRKNSPFQKGHPCYGPAHHTEETKKHLSQIHKGMHYSPETEFKPGHTLTKAEKHWNWKGGVDDMIQERTSSAWWRKLRKEIYQRDNWTCQFCGIHCSGRNIACHHIIKERLGGAHKQENLVTVCRRCHNLLDLHGIPFKLYTDIDKIEEAKETCP